MKTPAQHFTRRELRRALGLQPLCSCSTDTARPASDYLAAPPRRSVFPIPSLSGSGGRGTSRFAKVDWSALDLTDIGR